MKKRNVGRPKCLKNRELLSVSVEEKIKGFLIKKAEKEGTSISEVVRNILSSYFKKKKV